MALGIPTLATAIGANYRVIQDGENGFLIKDEQDWKNKILRLANDETLRIKIGQQARIEVENKFSLKANKDTYIGILNSLTNR
jgi:glycosyltransferase involved in cell wall biosynthesis